MYDSYRYVGYLLICKIHVYLLICRIFRDYHTEIWLSLEVTASYQPKSFSLRGDNGQGLIMIVL